MNNKDKIIEYLKAKNILYILFVGLLFLKIFNYYFVRLTHGAVLFLFYMGAALFSFFERREKESIKGKINRKKAFIAFWIFILFYFINFVVLGINDAAVSFWGFNISSKFYNIIIYASFMVFALNALSFRKELQKMIFYFGMIFITITVILTIRVLIQYPDAARVLAYVKREGSSQYLSMGAGGFDLIYAVLIMTPLLLIRINLYGNKMVNNFMLILAFVLIIISGYSLAILLLLLAFILTSYSRLPAFVKAICICIIFILLFFRGSNTYLIKLFDSIADNINNGFVEERFNSLSNALLENDFEKIQRVRLYQQSIQMFYNSPVFGNLLVDNVQDVSGHSTFFDLLGGMGIIGIIPYIVFHKYLYNMTLEYLNDGRLIKMYRNTTILFWVLQILNPIFASYIIGFTYYSFVPFIKSTVEGNGCEIQ